MVFPAVGRALAAVWTLCKVDARIAYGVGPMRSSVYSTAKCSGRGEFSTGWILKEVEFNT
jgi:hypothetical protein